MKINSNLAGVKLKSYSRKINWREIMNFAAGFNDNNPYYFDDEKVEGICAPPMFAVQTSWPIIENLSDYITVDNFPLEVIMTIVHYTEHLKIHRLIKPNDELTINGKIAAIIPHRAGTHIILQLETVNKANNPVFTEFIGGMLRGVECIGNSQGQDQIPIIQQYGDESDVFWEKIIYIDPLRSFIYDACTGMHFPIHTSKEFAHQVGLPGIILQGTATLAYAIKEITNKENYGNPTAIKEIACKFTNIVVPDSEIKVILKHKTKTNNGTNFYFEVLNDMNKKAISNGFLRCN